MVRNDMRNMVANKKRHRRRILSSGGGVFVCTLSVQTITGFMLCTLSRKWVSLDIRDSM